MKKSILMGVVSLSAVALLSACGEESRPASGELKGRISPAVDVDTQVTSAVSAGASESRAEASDVTVDDLRLTLTPADGSAPQSWENVSSFPVDNLFPVGDYTLEASYGDPATEGFGCPAFYGSTTLKVKENQTASVSLTATLANTMVSVDYTDAFREYMTAWNAELHSVGSANYIFYSQTETRPAYLTPGTVTVDQTFTMPNGKEATVEVANFTAEAKHHYHLTVDVNNGGVGKVVLEITFDDSLEIEPVLINLDDIVNAPAPEVTPKGFTEGTAVEFVTGMAPDIELGMDIVAMGGLSSVTLSTTCASLIAQGWPAEVELVNTPENIQSRMSALGFRPLGLWKNPDRMAVLDFAPVLAYITEAEKSGEASFTVTVSDRFHKSADPVTLTLSAQDLVMNISADKLTYTGVGEDVNLTLEYNGVDVADKVKFEYLSDRGIWDPMTVKNIAATSRATVNYAVTLSAPEVSKALSVRARCGAVTSKELTFGLLPSIAGSENDVFATRASFGIKGVLTEGCSFALSSDGGNTFSAITPATDGDRYSLTGLNPSTAYTLALNVDGERVSTFNFTTEAATQLENGDMEDWTSTAHKSNMVEYFVGGGIWGTLNPLTISQWGSSANCAYNATSGTRSTDGVNGSKGALIETVGWGSNNTAAGGGSRIKHVDRGELFLGKWGDAIQDDVLPQYGIEFASRPSALSFMYKFTAVKGHNGYAEVRVLDAAGNEIARNDVEITDQSSYTEMQLPLTYPAGAAKAASLIVIFRSCNVGKAIDGSSMGINDVNTVSILSSKYHNGSKLYVDDIKLIY